MLRLALLLLGLILLAHGADGTYRALKSRTQAQLTCDEFARQRPSSAWVRLTGCEVDYVNAGYRESAGDIWNRISGRAAEGGIAELLFPVRAAGADKTSPAPLVLTTRDPNVLAIAERTLGARSSIDQEAFLVMMLQVVTTMKASREIEGAIRGPLDTLRSRPALAAITAPLADGFAVLDLHARPDALLPGIELATGLLAVVAMAFWRKKSAPAEVPVLPPKGGSHTGGSHTGGSHTSGEAPPRLMLVNLPASAVPADIENAPPLGSQTEVRKRIAHVFPKIAFDDEGDARVVTGDHGLEIRLGKGDPVYTAVVEVKGNALGALSMLLEGTGWRAFAPRRGAFVGVSDLR